MPIGLALCFADRLTTNRAPRHDPGMLDGHTSLRVRVNRDSVALGDDIESHEQVFELYDIGDVADLVRELAARYRLPEIVDGRATWCLYSAGPIAVIAQEWPAPRMLSRAPRTLDECDVVDGTLHAHISYLAQADPDVACSLLDDVRIRDSRRRR